MAKKRLSPNEYSKQAIERQRGLKNFTQESRPQGTDPSRNVMLTGKSKVEQEEIQTKNALEGIMRENPNRAAQIASESTTNAEIMNRIREEQEARDMMEAPQSPIPSTPKEPLKESVPAESPMPPTPTQVPQEIQPTTPEMPLTERDLETDESFYSKLISGQAQGEFAAKATQARATGTTLEKAYYTGVQALAAAGLVAAGLAAVSTVAPTVLYSSAAKAAGWKSVTAASRLGWTPTTSELIWAGVKVIGNTLFSSKGLWTLGGAGALVTGVTMGARSMAAKAIDDMKDLSTQVKERSKTYEKAISDYQLDIQSFNSAKRYYTIASKIPVLKSLSKSLGVGTYFEIEQRNIDDNLYRNAIEKANSESLYGKPYETGLFQQSEGGAE